MQKVMSEKKNQPDLIIDNAITIAQLQVFMQAEQKLLSNLYERVETDDPAKREAVFQPLKQIHDQLWNCVDQLQKNADSLLIMNDITLQQ